jgi:hypothetical protein
MKTLQHKFVEFIPEQLENDVLYVSIPYCTAVHKCICGCGNEVVTPITPNDWQVTFDGETVSLSPSIGNWNFDCQSHYWIVNNKIRQSNRWTKDEIEQGRKADLKKKKKYFSKKKKK